MQLVIHILCFIAGMVLMFFVRQAVVNEARRAMLASANSYHAIVGDLNRNYNAIVTDLNRVHSKTIGDLVAAKNDAEQKLDAVRNDVRSAIAATLDTTKPAKAQAAKPAKVPSK